jgi:hypothetical protein
MSITGYECFNLYQALKLHFSSDSYDFFKYSGKKRTSVNSFESRKDKYYFYKLSRRLPNQEELILFLVSNFLENEECWIGNLLTEESEIIYRKRQKVLQSLSYIFENDCIKIFESVENPNEVLICKNGEYPKLLTMVLRNEIQLETFCILNKLLNFFPTWQNKITDTVRWPSFKRKVEKYAAFIQYDVIKYKIILRKVINESEKVVS